MYSLCTVSVERWPLFTTFLFANEFLVSVWHSKEFVVRLSVNYAAANTGLLNYNFYSIRKL